MCEICHGMKGCPVCGASGDRTVTCPDCNGEGTRYYAYDLAAEDEYECTEEEYMGLPDDYDTACATRVGACKSWSRTCRRCGGRGEIYGYELL